MLNVAYRTWLIGGWIMAFVTVSMSMPAGLSTTVLVGAFGVASGIMIALLEDCAASPSVAEIADDGRP